jgi:glycosyltransferase involved in cell wall biosynthesis
MIKVLFITGKLQHYRIPILNIIGNHTQIDLTVAHSGKLVKDAENSIKEIRLTENKAFGFTLHKENIYKLCCNYDVVVSMFYVQKLSLAFLAFKQDRPFKLIYWGIGVKASQSSKFDSDGISNIARNIIVKKADAMIFYTDYPIQKYVNQGNDSKKFFVMNNTVAISNHIKEEFERNILLFVGTLNKSKKIFVLLENYSEALKININIPELIIIGEGDDYQEAVEWVKKNELNNKIQFLGPIYIEKDLELYYKKALACISPGQAGLSVLKSMGYGVPFITTEDAITGGERLNIKHNDNGVLLKDESNLCETLLDITDNPLKYIRMGKSAQEFYNNNRTPEIMANGFIEAVNFVINNNLNKTR